MASGQISNHILMLLQHSKAQFIVKRAINYLSENIEESMKNEQFFEIDYELYGKQIIDKSNLSDEQKDDLRHRFENKDSIPSAPANNPPKQKPKDQAPKNDPIITKTNNEASNDDAPKRKPLVLIQTPSDTTMNPIRAPPLSKLKSQGSIPSKDDSWLSANEKKDSDVSNSIEGIPVTRTARRNSTYIRRPSKIALLE